MKQLKKQCEKQKSSLWSSIQQLFIDDSDDTIDILDIHEQLIHTLFYMMSPTFSLVVSRIKKYETYVRDTANIYIRDEWSVFRPLQNNSTIQSITALCQETLDKDRLLYNYNGTLIENISLIRTIHDTTKIYELLNIPIFSLMKNQSFKRLFKLVIACHGINKPNVINKE